MITAWVNNNKTRWDQNNKCNSNTLKTIKETIKYKDFME